MSYSPALKWSIALLLPLTLAWKMTVGLDDPSELKTKIVEFLVQHQFEVVVTDELMDDMPILRATREACGMLIMKTSPMGWRQDMIENLAAPTEHVFIVFRGRVYTEQPTWLTLVTHLWFRFLRELGLRRHTAPVLAVIAPAHCDVERLPWKELSERGVL